MCICMCIHTREEEEGERERLLSTYRTRIGLDSGMGWTAGWIGWTKGWSGVPIYLPRSSKLIIITDR